MRWFLSIKKNTRKILKTAAHCTTRRKKTMIEKIRRTAITIVTGEDHPADSNSPGRPRQCVVRCQCRGRPAFASLLVLRVAREDNGTHCTQCHKPPKKIYHLQFQACIQRDFGTKFPDNECQNRCVAITLIYQYFIFAVWMRVNCSSGILYGGSVQWRRDGAQEGAIAPGR